MYLYRTIFVSLFLVSSTFASPPTMREQMKNSLDQIAFSLDVYYAPSDWKRDWCGWNLHYQLDKAKNKIDESPTLTLKEYHKIVRDFVTSTQDYHVSVRFHSTEQSYIPFKIKGADNRFFISWIDRVRLPESIFPVKVGDEVIRFDGQPVLDVIKKLENDEVSKNIQGTDRRIAESRLTSRQGAYGDTVPTGKVSFTVLQGSKSKELTFDMKWIHNPEKVTPPFLSVNRSLSVNRPIDEAPAKETLASKFPRLHNQKQFVSPVTELLNNKEELGARVSFVPALGKKVWENDSKESFHAYIFNDAKGRKIGYVRIPHYSATFYEAQEFQRIIAKLNAQTSALVIDQVNNPGGSVFYLYTLASMLSNKPMTVPSQKIAVTQADVAEALQVIEFLISAENQEVDMSIISEMFDGYHVNATTIKKMKNGYARLIEEWNKGKFLTDSIYLLGIDEIEPYPGATYDKPILMLINEMDFSGGDFLPAILQDNSRVTLMGTRTAGAGGFVLKFDFPNRLGIRSYNVTGSIAERMTLKPIENLGVEPDIHYELTPKDLKEGYIPYKEAIKKALMDILG